jgi:hypothetical protein
MYEPTAEQGFSHFPENRFHLGGATPLSERAFCKGQDNSHSAQTISVSWNFKSIKNFGYPVVSILRTELS